MGHAVDFLEVLGLGSVLERMGISSVFVRGEGRVVSFFGEDTRRFRAKVQ